MSALSNLADWVNCVIETLIALCKLPNVLNYPITKCPTACRNRSRNHELSGGVHAGGNACRDSWGRRVESGAVGCRSRRRDHVIVGNAARKYLIETPERSVYSIKRLMGRGIEDIREEVKLFPFHLADDLESGEVLRIKLGDKTFTPPEISAFILRQLKRNAERFFNAPVTQAVITVPAYFNDAQRQATKDAGRIAGLEVLRLVNEPTAASLAYGLDKKQNGIVAVYDLGGGTFDVSILKLHDGIFEVIATNGDTHLGGDDIDNLLIAIARHQRRLGLDVSRNGEAVATIRKAVIEAKIALSSQPSTKLAIDLPEGKSYLREITREQFEH